jgi:nucleotide-binding universal stress UspA family protein
MRILIALDRSEYSEIVVEHAFDQAVREHASDLHVVTVVADAGEIEATRTWLESVLRDAIDTFRYALPYTVHVRCGIPAVSIASVAIEVSPDLIVIGRFHALSVSDELLELVDYPTLIVGIDGPLLEPQCPACGEVRVATRGERLFCDAHRGDVLPELSTRLPPSTTIGSRMW